MARTLRRCPGCGKHAYLHYHPPVMQYICNGCHARWNAAHMGINADPAASAYRRRVNGDAAAAMAQYRIWWGGERRERRS